MIDTLGQRKVCFAPRSTRALDLSQGVFTSFARSPSFGVYEGETGLIHTRGPPSGRGKGRIDGRSEDFEVNLGKVMDTLRQDYPRIFYDPLDFDIYTPDITVHDPSGVALSGINNYKRLFATLRFFRKMMLTNVSTSFKLSYDWSRQQVRVKWHFLFETTTQMPRHVDGISVYHINNQGMVRRHDLETISVNGTPAEPPFAHAWINMPAWLGQPASPGLACPGGAARLTPFFDIVPSLHWPPLHPLQGAHEEISIAVNSLACRNPRSYSGSTGVWDDSSGSGFLSNLCVSSGIALKGLVAFAVAFTTAPGRCPEPPGLELLGVVAAVGLILALGGMTSRAAIDESKESEVIEERGGLMEGSREGESQKKKKKAQEKKSDKRRWWPLTDVPNGCETSWDCEGGQVCCNFVLVKVCCSNGVRQRVEGQLVPQLIPARDYPQIH
ncbi:unnamed protein product [Choristocarpus tenellus]